MMLVTDRRQSSSLPDSSESESESESDSRDSGFSDIVSFGESASNNQLCEIPRTDILSSYIPSFRDRSRSLSSLMMISLTGEASLTR